MKKLLAILLSVLMLCSMIPFATVSAADVATIELVVEETELNAGDEFEVTVNLLNIPAPGLMGAIVALDYDSTVMDLTWTYDEDEEMDFPSIEVGSKYNASSNKYITFGPMGSCLVLYDRLDGKETVARQEEHYYTATFTIKDDAPTGEYTISVKDYNPKNMVSYGNVATDFELTTVTLNITGNEPAHTCQYVETERKAATCGADGYVKYACSCGLTKEDVLPATGEHVYFDDCSAICDVCGYEREVSHNVQHYDAVAPTCTAMGNIEYWQCTVCGATWLDANCIMNSNPRAVKLPATGHAYDDEFDADCNNGCGEIREAAALIITCEGASACDNVYGEGRLGLAFKFDAAVAGLEYLAGEGLIHVGNYDNAYVDGVKVAKMGATVKTEFDEQNVDAYKLYDIAEDGASATYVVRVIDIPAECTDIVITATPYIVYAIDGVETTVSFRSISASYDSASANA